MQNEKQEIHTVFRCFPFFCLTKNLSLPALANLFRASQERNETMKRVFYIVLGCIGVGLGALGAVLPLLPAFPFLMLAAWSFAKSSKKLDAWFKGTKLYKNNLADFAAGRGMTRKTKVRIM